MGDFLLTRADRALFPEKWPVWPRAGPSTLVRNFEGNIFFEGPCSSMVDYLLTRADRALSPEEWPVRPRAGPSTPVWIFEGKIFLRDHPRTRAEGVLSPGIWPVCQPDTARSPTSREHPCKAKLSVHGRRCNRTGAYGLVRGRTTGTRWGRVRNGEKCCVAAQPDFNWTWCRPPQGPRP